MNSLDYIKDRIFKGSAGLSQGIFVMLGIGLLLKNIGVIIDFQPLITIGIVTVQLVAPAIGAGIAFSLGSNFLTILSSIVAATIGAAALTITPEGIKIVTGEPVGATLAAIVATFIGKKISGKTPLDMMVIPLTSVLIGGLFGLYISKITTPLLIELGGLITHATTFNAIISSIVIAIAWGIFVMSPASSVMLALALNLNPMASAAALIGCTAHFIGFTIMSYKKASPGALMAIFLCTPKVQMPNVTKNPMLLIPPSIAAAITAPIVVNIFGLTTSKEIAGMGLSSFVAPLNLFIEGGFHTLGIFLLGVGLCGIISYIIYMIMKKMGIISSSDLVM
ncbi:MAG: PTS transporter subunit IIC [Chitinophagaceae bacterium]